MQKLRGSIIGSITSTTGSSLASVQIRVKGTETTAYTDTSGNFTINNLPVGSYTLQISADNYIGQDISVTVVQNENSPVSVSLTHQTANVQGYARSTTGEIITYTQATIPGTSYTAYVNESGQFTFYNLPVGYTIQEIVIADYQPKLPLPAITVTPNLNSIGTLEFQPVGTITGVVRASDATNNNPVLSNVTVTLQAIGDSYVQTTTSDENGSFSFSNIPANASYTLTIEKAGYVLYPMQPFTVTRGQNYKYLYLQQGVAVTNETQLLAAYANTSVPYILLLNDIHLTEPFNFNRPISLGGVSVSNSNIKLSSPNFLISSPGVGWSGLDMYCDVGNDETKLRAALYSFVGAIKLNGLGNYDGIIKIVSQKNYFITDGTSNLTAFVNNAEGLGNALANPNVSTIYVAENIYSYGNLNLPNRSIHFTSQSEKAIQKDSYSNASQVQLTNVRLLPEHDTVPPTLTAVSTGDVELDLQDVKATLNEAATLYLVPEGTTRVLGEITSHAVTSVFASTDGQASLKLASVPPGDYVLYAVDSTGNISVPSAVIHVHKSVSKVLSDIRHGLDIANMTWITTYDFKRAGLQNIDEDHLDLYQFALNMDKDALLSASSNQDFVTRMQGWIDVANIAPVIQRALMSGFYNSFNWSILNNNAEGILSAYQLTGISSNSQLAIAEHFMELEFQRGNYKLLSRTAIQEAINDSLPSPELSNWEGTPIQQGLGTKRVALRLSIKNAKGISLKGYTANDLTVKINGEETSLSDSEIFPSLVYDNVSSSYQIVFAGEESSTTYTLSDLSLRGVVIQAEELSVTTPDLGVPVTSIELSIYTNSNRIPTNSSSTVSLNIAPNNATNKNIFWSIEPSGIATVSQQGYLNVTGIGHFTLTAKNELYGISQTLELEAVDSGSALSAVQAYAASEGTASLTLEDLKNTCVGNIVDTAFDNYKRAIVAKRGEFVGLQNYQISNLLQDIFSEYTSTAALNQALYAYIDDNPAAWDALDKDTLATFGVYQADATNFQYVKQVILDTFIEDGGPLGRTQLNTLVANVPSFSIRDYNPTVYATQMISQHLKNDGSNVVVTFKVANLYNEGNTGLTSQDVKAIVDGETRGLYDSALFSNFLNLGNGVYSFEVLQSALANPLSIDALKVRVGYSYIPIATEISVSRQAALIEHAVANHTLNIVDELLFTAGNLPSLLGLSFTTLTSNLESAYVAHGNVLTEGSIRRIINGMHIVRSFHQTPSASTDTYNLEFHQNITGSLMYSVFARNQSGYLAMNGTGYYSNLYNFTFGHASTFPVVLSYISTPTEKLRYSSDNSFVPDFEIIFTNSSP
ncbi:MSCRAMM family protein [Paenibacillus sp. Soil750]|uniref:MSCRAMM family protein n=1 Tax=Paenibacillus sp. Soil750 TaxID=1736398 RepID=UPI003FA744C8